MELRAVESAAEQDDVACVGVYLVRQGNGHRLIIGNEPLLHVGNGNVT